MIDRPVSRTVVACDWPVFVRTLRSEQYLDCTQEGLAGQMEVCTSSVTKWEAGVVKPQSRHRWALRELAVRAGYNRRQWPSRSWEVRLAPSPASSGDLPTP